MYQRVYNQAQRVNGTHKQGHVSASYNHLVRLFGQPSPKDCGKVQVEWFLEGPEGAIYTLYDWKQTTPPVDTTTWNIGAHGPTGVEELIRHVTGS
jgi:hypothetical protein